MNVYLIRFAGHYIGGELLVVTTSKRKAFNKAKKEIEQMGLSGDNQKLSMDDVEELSVEKESVYVIDNGDY